MNSVSITAVIYDTNIDQLNRVFNKIFSELKFSTKNKTEIYIEGDGLEIYVYSDSGVFENYQYGNSDYLLEASVEVELEEGEKFIRNIIRELEVYQLKYMFDYFVRNSTSEEKMYMIRHPELDNE